MFMPYCTICKDYQEIQGGLAPGQTLFPLVCGHSFNNVTGECYTAEQMEDTEQTLQIPRATIISLLDTINALCSKLESLLLLLKD